MNIDKFMVAFAGTMVLTGLALGTFHDPDWYWLSAFVGANMLQASFTGFCPLAKLLRKLGMKPGTAFG